jgi:hypothetical protein
MEDSSLLLTTFAVKEEQQRKLGFGIPLSFGPHNEK